MATLASLSLTAVSGSLPEPEAIEVMDVRQTKWSLTREGFDRLLDCLDPDREKAGQQYEIIRSKLIHYFDWRDCPFPEEHADETINRVIRKLDAGEAFRDVSTY